MRRLWKRYWNGFLNGSFLLKIKKRKKSTKEKTVIPIFVGMTVFFVFKIRVKMY